MKKILLIGVAFMAMGAKKDPNALPAPQAITAKDRAEGSKAHPQLVAEFGGAYDAPQAAYVARVGKKIAVQSGLSNTEGDFTVTLLNSNVNNAFAIPGGYVYVTRQLLALMNDEAELASVMGHEVGHVAAGHSRKRQKRNTTGQIGAILATVAGAVIAGGEGAKIGQQLGGAIAQNYVLSFSRSQEFQADDLGVSYLGKSGYDPMAASDMLASLAAENALELRRTGGKQVPVRQSTHPDPGARVTRAAGKANATAGTGTARNRDQFLNAIDGMMYDDDPQQGVVDGQNFKHPGLKLAFTAPSGFSLLNSTQAVVVRGANRQAIFQNASYNGNLSSYVDSVFKALGGGQATLNYGSVSTTQVNGIPAAYASASAQTESGPALVTVFAYELDKSSAFHFYAVTAQNEGNLFESLFQSMRRLSASEAAAIKPRKVDVVTAKGSDSVASLSARMAYPDYREERFRILNALGTSAAVKPGQRYKIIVY